MNHFAIDLNNRGVEQLQQQNPFKAMELFSNACDLLNKNRGHQSNSQNYGGASMMMVTDEDFSCSQCFQFHWVDGSSAFTSYRLPPTMQNAAEGTMPFLFLRFLKINALQVPQDEFDFDDDDENFEDDIFEEDNTNTSSGRSIKDVCPCGFSWAVYYNLAVVCSVFGTRLGERGQQLLQRANILFQQVQYKIDSESPSIHWGMLQLAVLNNQACIAFDMVKTEDLLSKLDYLSETLFTGPLPSYADWKNFFLTLNILERECVAPAA